MKPEALKSKQKEIFEKLRNFPEFYLAGGTALALQMGHRISVDFDLFSDREIPEVLLDKINKVFDGFEIKIVINHSEQLSLMIDGVKIDFVKYNFPLVTDFVDFNGVKMISPKEIAPMKAYALNYRGTLKDYIDLYFILKEKYATLEEIKTLAEKKYGHKFDFRLFLEQLLYLKDISEEPIEFLKEPATKEEMINFFEKEIQKIKI